MQCCNSRWFGSNWVSMPLALSFLVLTLALLVVVQFHIDLETMHDKYALVPQDVSPDESWGIALAALVPVLFMMITVALVFKGSRCSRWLLYLTSIALLSLLLVGNLRAASQTKLREASEPNFALIFDDYYCAMRTARACLSGNQLDQLVLIRGNATALSTKNENVTEAAFALWGRCRQVTIASMSRAVYGEDDDPSDLKIDADRIHQFLDDCNGSRETDAWCGRYNRQVELPTFEEHKTPPAPYAANLELFPKYTREWSKRMRYSNGIAGAAVACLMVTAWSWKARASRKDYDGW
ncbi:hypothetical protein Gpo141_00000878 [Globisporangium polare]